MIKNIDTNGNNNNCLLCARGFPGGTGVKELDYGMQVDVRDAGSVPGLGRFPRGGHGYPLQYSCLEYPHRERSLWSTVHGVTKSQTQLRE